MKYIVFNTVDGELHRLDSDNDLIDVYADLVDNLGGADAFNEHCVVIRGGEEVTLNTTVQINSKIKKPVYREGPPVDPE